MEHRSRGVRARVWAPTGIREGGARSQGTFCRDGRIDKYRFAPPSWSTSATASDVESAPHAAPNDPSGCTVASTGTLYASTSRDDALFALTVVDMRNDMTAAMSRHATATSVTDHAIGQHLEHRCPAMPPKPGSQVEHSGPRCPVMHPSMICPAAPALPCCESRRRTRSAWVVVLPSESS